MKRMLALAGAALAALLAAGCGEKPNQQAMYLSTSGAVRVRGVACKKMDLGKANQFYREGVEFYLKGRPGAPNSNLNLSRAKKKFRGALEIYEKASKVDPGNSALEGRIQDCNMKIYACSKMMTL